MSTACYAAASAHRLPDEAPLLHFAAFVLAGLSFARSIPADDGLKKRMSPAADRRENSSLDPRRADGAVSRDFSAFLTGRWGAHTRTYVLILRRRASREARPFRDFEGQIARGRKSPPASPPHCDEMAP